MTREVCSGFTNENISDSVIRNTGAEKFYFYQPLMGWLIKLATMPLDFVSIQKHKVFFLAFITLIAGSCSSGYQKQNGNWVWVTYDESSGKRVLPLSLADQSSFTILENSNYAKDNIRVYFKGGTLLKADPASFELINSDGYAKDKKHVFLEWSRVIHADPATFEVLGFPYARDANHIFCGTIPILMDKEDMASFVVTNEDKLMENMRSTTLLSHFIEMNPEYAWLDTLNEKHVVTGEWGSAETITKIIKGYTVKAK